MKRVLSLLVVAVVFVGAVSAQSALDILNKHIEAVGGQEAWSKVESAHAKLSVSVEMQMGVIVLEAETWNLYPGHMLAVQTLISAPDGIPDIGSTTYISPDEAWTENFQGRQDISGNLAAAMGGNMPSLASALQESEMIAAIDTLDITVEAQEEINGKTVNVLAVGGPAPSKRFYDAESGLLIATEANSPMGAVRMNISEYQEVDGLKVPFIQEGQMGAMGTQTIAFTLFELNTGLTPEDLAKLAEGDDD